MVQGSKKGLNKLKKKIVGKSKNRFIFEILLSYFILKRMSYFILNKNSWDRIQWDAKSRGLTYRRGRFISWITDSKLNLHENLGNK